MNERIDLTQLVERVARGRRGRPNCLELALEAMGRDPFGDAEQALQNQLDDPRVSIVTKQQVTALLRSIGEDVSPIA
jgi:hypothetical protein